MLCVAFVVSTAFCFCFCLTALLVLFVWLTCMCCLYSQLFGNAAASPKLSRRADLCWTGFCFSALLFSAVPVILTLSGRHPHGPSFIYHIKGRLEWMDHGPMPNIEQRKVMFFSASIPFFKKDLGRESKHLMWDDTECTPSPSASLTPSFIFSFFLPVPQGLGGFL